MKKLVISIMALAMTASAIAQNTESHFKFYGFIRNYLAYDSRESESGTQDLFYYMPKDRNINSIGQDMNQRNSFRFLALTSRVGVDVSGYEFKDVKVGAKIEADFYCMSTNTATLRLRQAYLTLAFKNATFKMGQAWHPMAADMPDVISLAIAAPFGPFSRTPLAMIDWNLNQNFMLTGAAIWQMQYVSMGPSGSSANYMKYGCTPEIYLGLTYKNGGFLARAGAEMLSIKPRWTDSILVDEKTHTFDCADRYTTVSPYVYLQYKKDLFTAKLKSTFARGGEHMNLLSGYALSKKVDVNNWKYTPYRSSTSWLSLSYGKTVQGVLLLAYAKNFGTKDPIISTDQIYFLKNAWNLNQLFRATPTIIYNMGKVQFGLEYELTGAQYGEKSYVDLNRGIVADPAHMHWILNHRVQGMVKYTF